MAISDLLSAAGNALRSTIRPGRLADVVGVMATPGFTPAFPSAQPLAALVYESAEVMRHPLEMGTTIVDHIVVQPVEINLPLRCIGEVEYRATYAAIKSNFLRGERLTVQTRTGGYPNMLIASMPHEETPGIYDGVSINLNLVEAKFVVPESELSTSQVANNKDASTVSKGSQQTRNTPAATESRAKNNFKQSGMGNQKPSGSTLYRWLGE